VRATTAVRLAAILGTSVLVGCAGLPSGEPPSARYGRWVLNSELTREAQPEGKASGGGTGGFGRPRVTVGGLPVPGPGGGATPAISGNARDPGVLRCEQLEIEAAGDAEVRLTYVDVDSEQLRAGDDQGRFTRWTRVSARLKPFPVHPIHPDAAIAGKSLERLSRNHPGQRQPAEFQDLV